MPKRVSEILGGVTAKSAILIVFNTDCCLKVISWQYSVKKSKMKNDKFGAFGAAERQPVRFCAVRFTAVVKFTVCIPFCLIFSGFMDFKETSFL